MHYLGLAFLLAFGLEILSIIIMADWVGGLVTLGLMILSFITGLFIMRRTAGFAKVLMAGGLLRGKGSLSFYQMMWPVRIPVAAFLLMLPGFLSTFGALILLLPIKGKPITHTQTFSSTFGGTSFDQTHTNTQNGDIIEGDFVVRNANDAGHTPKRKLLDVIEHQKD